jgi:SP family general alpha glucoside:H+ symporter-like MFS transporter
MSAAPIGFISAAETGTPRLKALTTGFAIGCYGALNLVFQFTVPLMLATNGANWGVKAGYLFAGLGALGTVGIYIFTPEVCSLSVHGIWGWLTRFQTAGRTFSEIDELFELGTSPRKFAVTETSAQRAGIVKKATIV